MGISRPINFRIRYNKPALIIRRNIITVKGLKDSKACFIHTKEKAQHIIDKSKLPNTLKRSDMAQEFSERKGNKSS